MFDLQDKIVEKVVGAISPRVQLAEIERSRRKPVESLDAYDCFLRGIAGVNSFDRIATEEALKLFYRAIEMDPSFPTPYGLAARAYMHKKVQGWTDDADWEEAETRRLALRVAAIGQDDALALSWAGPALAYVCREYEMGAAFAEQALSLNQIWPRSWSIAGTSIHLLENRRRRLSTSLTGCVSVRWILRFSGWREHSRLPCCYWAGIRKQSTGPRAHSRGSRTGHVPCGRQLRPMHLLAISTKRERPWAGYANSIRHCAYPGFHKCSPIVGRRIWRRGPKASASRGFPNEHYRTRHPDPCTDSVTKSAWWPLFGPIAAMSLFGQLIKSTSLTCGSPVADDVV